jgi:hypothetical protein
MTEINKENLSIIERFVYEKHVLGYKGMDIHRLMKAQLPTDAISPAAISQTLQRLGLRPTYTSRGRPKKVRT